MGTIDRLGQRLRQLRLQRRWSQGQLALKAGVTRPYISKLERGHIKSPGAEGLSRLSEALQVDASELLAAAGYVSTPIGPINLADPRWNFVMRVLGEQPPDDQQMILEMILPVILRKEEENLKRLERQKENRRHRQEEREAS